MTWIKLAAGAVLLFGLAIIANHELDVWGNRWAYASPPLLDRWSGETTTDAGTRLDLVLTLRRGSLSDPIPISDQSGPGDRDIDGRAILCDGTGHRVACKVGGFVRDARGRGALLTLSQDGRRTPGPTVSRLELAWNLADALTATATLNRATSSGTVWSSSDRDLSRPVSFPLRRARASGNRCP
jgi:hypothetical protein